MDGTGPRNTARCAGCSSLPCTWGSPSTLVYPPGCSRPALGFGLSHGIMANMMHMSLTGAQRPVQIVGIERTCTSSHAEAVGNTCRRSKSSQAYLQNSMHVFALVNKGQTLREGGMILHMRPFSLG